MTEAIMERLQSNAKRLTGERKGRSRKPPPELASQSDLAEYAVKHNYPALHSASVPGITCLDVHDNIMVRTCNLLLKNFIKTLRQTSHVKLRDHKCGFEINIL